jgi:hypothetical protein
MQRIIGKPAEDKGILANTAIFKYNAIEIMRTEFRSIYDMERGSTEVGFEHDFEPMTRKFGIWT